MLESDIQNMQKQVFIDVVVLFTQILTSMPVLMMPIIFAF